MKRTPITHLEFVETQDVRFAGKVPRYWLYWVSPAVPHLLLHSVHPLVDIDHERMEVHSSLATYMWR